MWQELDVPPPPVGLTDSLIAWIKDVEARLYVTIVDGPGLTPEEIEQLAAFCGEPPHAELVDYYRLSSPWGLYRDGLSMWQKVLSQVKELHGGNPFSALTPALWPIALGGSITIAAFIDQRDRVVCIEIGDQGRRLWLRSIGVWGYLVSTVVIEFLMDRGIHASYEYAVRDPRVRALAGLEHIPVHPFLPITVR